MKILFVLGGVILTTGLLTILFVVLGYLLDCQNPIGNDRLQKEKNRKDMEEYRHIKEMAKTKN